MDVCEQFRLTILYTVSTLTTTALQGQWWVGLTLHLCVYLDSTFLLLSQILFCLSLFLRFL